MLNILFIPNIGKLSPFECILKTWMLFEKLMIEFEKKLNKDYYL